MARRAVVILEADEASPLFGQHWQNLPLLQLRAEGRRWTWSCAGESAREPFWEWEFNGHGIGGLVGLCGRSFVAWDRTTELGPSAGKKRIAGHIASPVLGNWIIQIALGLLPGSLLAWLCNQIMGDLPSGRRMEIDWGRKPRRPGGRPQGPSSPGHFNKELTPLGDLFRSQPADSRRLFRCLGAHLLRSP